MQIISILHRIYMFVLAFHNTDNNCYKNYDHPMLNDMLASGRLFIDLFWPIPILYLFIKKFRDK